jgi:hypothetical protein
MIKSSLYFPLFSFDQLALIANASSNAISNQNENYRFDMIINLPSSKSSIIGRK